VRAAIALCALVAAGCAQPMVSPRDDAASVIEAERAFAAESVRTDMRAAFMAHFSPDGVFVRGGWVNAREALRERAAPPITLDWAPRHVEVARSGELALSTGPWTRTSRTQPAAAAAHGQFVSIWRRQPEGAWKVEVDLGISHPDGAEEPGNVEVVVPAAMGTTGGTLEAAEARFVETSLRSGSRAAYAAHALPRLLFYRDGHAPVRGKDSALRSDAMTEEKIVWLADRVEASRSRDFGYVRGSYADAADPARVLGYFLRVWRRGDEGWRVALDVTNPSR
jgi:ketosteroid isomerase-like protein